MISGTRGGPPSEKIMRYRAGRSGTILVCQNTEHGSRTICVDDQPVAATSSGNLVDSKMLAHLPLLLHPHPKTALTVGYGSGGTSWSMVQHGIEVECVEIEAEVPKSSNLFLTQNYNVLNEPNFLLTINDARNHLHTTQKKYDVISTDVTNLQYKQNGSLYTKEYFELMKRHLTVDGIACAWIPITGISEQEFKTLLRTWSEVYTHSSLWFMNHTYTNFAILIATPNPLSIDMDRIQEGFSDPKIKDDLQKIRVNHPYQFVHFLLMGEDGIRQFTDQAPIHTDDHPVLEFYSVLSFYQWHDIDENNVLMSLAYRPKNIEGLLRGTIDRELCTRFSQASEKWIEVIGRVSSDSSSLPVKQRKENLQVAIRLGKEATTLVPDNLYWDSSLPHLENRLESLKNRD